MTLTSANLKENISLWQAADKELLPLMKFQAAIVTGYWDTSWQLPMLSLQDK